MPTTPEELRAFLARPWGRLRTLKDRHHVTATAQGGADAAFRVAEVLRAHAIEIGALPSAQERSEDLAVAVRLRRSLDRASRRSRRPR